jgi:hypothetical protein
VHFIKLAREFSEDLHLLYGDEMSITKFGRILLELKGQKTLKDLVHLDDIVLQKHLAYNKAKKEMIEEQNLFRSSFSAQPVELTELETVQDLFDAETRSDTAVAAPSQPFRGKEIKENNSF